MNWHNTLAIASLAVDMRRPPAHRRVVARLPHIIAPPDQIVAVKAGHLFDSKSGAMLSNQVVLMKGDRITDVGASVQIPPGAKVIDLSGATVLPGMIDTHVHVNTGGSTSTPAAQRGPDRARERANRSRCRLHHSDGYGFARRFRHRRSAR